jgi:hypothetical protein
VATVDQHHARVRMLDQRVGEGHAHGARAHHHVVGLQHGLRHGPMLTGRRTLVNRPGRLRAARRSAALGSAVFLVGAR